MKILIATKNMAKFNTIKNMLDEIIIDEKVSKVCNEFKISDEMLSRKINSLSGGEKTNN